MAVWLRHDMRLMLVWRLLAAFYRLSAISDHSAHSTLVMFCRFQQVNLEFSREPEIESKEFINLSIGHQHKLTFSHAERHEPKVSLQQLEISVRKAKQNLISQNQIHQFPVHCVLLKRKCGRKTATLRTKLNSNQYACLLFLFLRFFKKKKEKKENRFRNKTNDCKECVVRFIIGYIIFIIIIVLVIYT